jgi:hypothetical protein
MKERQAERLYGRLGRWRGEVFPVDVVVESMDRQDCCESRSFSREGRRGGGHR